VVKNGRTKQTSQLYLCKQCGTQFVRRYRFVKWQKKLFQEYTFGKKTLTQLADQHGKSIKTIQRHLDAYEVDLKRLDVQPVVIGMDCSFFGRGYGIIVARCPNLKRNLYWKEITTENKAVYEEARQFLIDSGFDVKAVVIDAKHGIKEVFNGTVIQICQYHQQQIIHRYLTNRPKTQAGQELRLLVKSLTRQTEQSFSATLQEWHEKWRLLLAERTMAPDGKHWWYTHRQLRAAYRSLHTNLPYLFSYLRYPELRIPNTNNSMEGYFSRLKTLLNNHHGLKIWRRYRLIEEVLNNPSSS
jgi:hypothetical protein